MKSANNVISGFVLGNYLLTAYPQDRRSVRGPTHGVPHSGSTLAQLRVLV